jgi:hypothetical protein
MYMYVHTCLNLLKFWTKEIIIIKYRKINYHFVSFLTNIFMSRSKMAVRLWVDILKKMKVVFWSKMARNGTKMNFGHPKKLKLRFDLKWREMQWIWISDILHLQTILAWWVSLYIIPTILENAGHTIVSCCSIILHVLKTSSKII